MKRKRKSNGPFVAVPKAIMTTPAWRAMSLGGRLLSNCGGGCATMDRTTGKRTWPVAMRQKRSAPNPKVRLCAGMPKTSTTASSARQRKASSASMVAESRRTIVSPISLTGRIRQPEISRNGMANRSPIPPAATPAKNRIPYPPWVHPVPTIGTYGSPGMGGPYVPTMGTYATPRGVPTMGTDLDFHTPLQKKSSYRVAQQLERRCKPEEPVRARPLFPA